MILDMHFSSCRQSPGQINDDQGKMFEPPALKRMLRFRIGLLSAALLSSCVANKPYRLGGIADEIYPDQKPNFEETMVSLDRTVQLSFVEFDEKGDFWD